MKKFKFGKIQKKWLKSLREHPERQLKRYLGHKRDGSEDYQACCLGELAIIAGKACWEGDTLRVEGSQYVLLNFEELGLMNNEGASSADDFISLASLNDSSMTWPEIADHVEKHGEFYFTKSF